MEKNKKTKKEQRINFRTPYKYQFKKSDKETPSGVSKTIPDQSYTIQELLEKFTHGLDLGINQTGQYDEEPSLDQDVTLRTPGSDFTHIEEKIHKEEVELSIKEAKQQKAEAKKKSESGESLQNDGATEELAEQMTKEDAKPRDEVATKE